MSRMYRVRMASSGWTGGPGLNTFYFVNSSDDTTSSDTDAQLCADYVRAAAYTDREVWPSLTTLVVDSVVDVLDAASGTLLESYGVTPPDSVVGAGAATYGPTAAMICGSLLTADVVSGHRVRGRAFIGPLPLYADTNGSPVAGQLGHVQTFLEELASGTGGPPTLVVWHRPVGGSGGQACKVTSVFVRDKFAVLRSRRD